VSTKNIVDTIVVSGRKLSKVEGLNAYNQISYSDRATGFF